MERESSEKVEASVPFPPEMVMEILSWLPVKPLARAQLVCREWRAQIQDHRFLELHINRTLHTSYWYNSLSNTDDDDQDIADQADDQDIAEAATPEGRSCTFSIFHGCNGLILMWNNTLEKDLVWNPAARLVLELPPYPGTGDVYGRVLSFVPFTQNYKAVFLSEDLFPRAHRCFHVVTLGRSMEWRRLAFPDLNTWTNANSKPRGSLVPTGGAVHYCEDGVTEIVSLDLETEVITLNHLPPGILRYNHNGKAIECDGRLGFAVLVGQDVEVMVLEDYRCNRWCRDKQVIPLPYLKVFGGSVELLWIKQGEIWLCSQNENVYAYEIETGKIRFVVTCKGNSDPGQLRHVYRPSYVTFEGMLRAEADLEALVAPHRLLLD